MSRKVIEDSEITYDVVIIGAGICGGILAKELGEQGKKVLILECGKETDFSFSDYMKYVNTFYTTNAKTPSAPYPNNPNAPQPDVLDVKPIYGLAPDLTGYFVQKGTAQFRSTYTRVTGGTTMHWLGTCLRMLPEDFKMHKMYGLGLDWPMTYEDLMPYYIRAEQEIGVSGDVEDQKYLGIHFEDGYVYPMKKIPQSYLDQKLVKGLKGMSITNDGENYPIIVSSTPQGRNGMPNPDYYKFFGKADKQYEPVGAVGNSKLGQRCAGNTSCVPICPIQAKYNAMKTIIKALETKNVDILQQAVASKILVNADNGRIKGIEYKRYHNNQSPEHTIHIARGKIYVLAAHAVENAKLLLASGITSTSGLVGKNLMDHPVMLTWGLMPEKIGSFRGPLSTSGIESLRGGKFRRNRAAFRIEIGNEGWNWTVGAPYSMISNLVDKNNLYGTRLRKYLNESIPRQLRLGFLLEQLPDTSNRITIDPAFKDQLGNYRPVIHYNISEHTKAGMAAGKYVSNLIFQRLGAEDYTNYDPLDPGYLTYQGEGYVYQGAGHFAGTHIMGTSKYNSVVDRYQKCWDHENLYLTGCGNMPTMATSNPTLTMAALTFWAADNILEDLKKGV
ncbi:GMC family oxidoreductase [Bacillus thuringiensis]|uniref:GMC family oxidoreductase n=1 Tax=Bacillus thuringiensis TaxID=1428 RepID=UPI00197B01AC|nr:GMC family oxidoreductase [Bacillus thuringiensis]